MKKLLLYFFLVITFNANAQFWTEKATGFTTANRGLYIISIVDANVVWALGVDNQPTLDDLSIKEFTKSTDSGNTWIPGTIDLGANSADMDISSITAASATTAWVSVAPGATNTGGIWKTTDGGANWTKQTTASFNGVDSFANIVHFWDTNNGVALGDPESGEFEIYTTSDGGINWTRVDGTNIPDPNVNEYGVLNRFSVSGNTIWFGTDSGRLYKSTDKGLTWTATQSISLDFTQDRFTFSDDNNGLLTIYQDNLLLYRTIDGGSSWTQVTKTGELHSDISYIPGTSTVIASDWKIPPDATNYIIGSSYSLDNGITWTTIDNIQHGTLKLLNSSFGFSAGFNTDATTGGIFKFTGLPLSTPNFDGKKNILAYPNPTNGMLKLNSDNTLIKEASVFDITGKRVYNSNFSSLNTIDLDLKPLETGLYLLKVTSDSGKIDTMKIMKN